MAFRADEAEQRGYESARNYLITRDIDVDERVRSERMLEEIVDKFGPVIDAYPSWHPLVSNTSDKRVFSTAPDSRCGYKGLDHTVAFANAFVTCPDRSGQDVIDAVNKLPPNPDASIFAERLDVQFYHRGATPVLVGCEWARPLPIEDGMIPKSLAVPLMLEQELSNWRTAEVAETWETMRPYFLGRPHGGRSSLFVNQETGQAMKNVWNALIKTDLFGPIMV